MTKILRAPLLATLTLVAGCSTNSPAQRAAESIEDASNNRAAVIRGEFDNRAEAIRDQSDQLRAQAKATTGYEGRILKTRADALKEESQLIAEQGQAKADAAKTAGQADAKAIRAQ